MLAQVAPVVVDTTHFVEWTDLLTVVGGVVAVILGITAIIYAKIGNVSEKVNSVSERVAVTEKQNENDDHSFKILFSKLEQFEQARNNDRQLFNENINKLTLTLGKIEVTMENNNEIIKELKEELNKR